MNTYWVTRFGQSIAVEDHTKTGLPKLFGETFECFDFSVSDSLSRQAQEDTIRITSRKGAWLIEEVEGDYSVLVNNAGDLAYFLSDRVIYHLIKNMTEGHCVHAACVAKGKKAIVMPAQSGAGKSSLACWLIANGFDYVTDELVIFSENNSVSAIPRPLQIKQSGTTVIQPLIKLNINEELNKQRIIRGDIASSYSPNIFGSNLSPLNSFELALILFPKYTKNTTYSFTKVSNAETAVNLMASHVNARCLEMHGFKFMSILGRASNACSIEYGGYSMLKNCFLDDLKLYI